MNQPKPSVFDPKFKYTPANNTDIAKTFERLCPGWKTKRNNGSASTVGTAEQTTLSRPVTER